MLQSISSTDPRICLLLYLFSLFFSLTDDVPECHADSSYCPHFGLEYVCEEPFDYTNASRPNATCKTGTRVRCSFPDLSVQLIETPADVIRVMAYNVFELRYLYHQSGQKERTCRILPEVLKMHPDLDVIVFNEVFMGGCFAQDEDNLLEIRDILDEYGFPHHTKTVGAIPDRRQPENGGIFIASKWPIEKQARKVFDHISRWGDSTMKKGVSYAKVVKNVGGVSQVYHVFGTHLQAYERENTTLYRELQAQEMYDFMLDQNIPAEEAVIYGGDLNADRANRLDHSDDIISILHSTLPTLTGDLQYTYDKVNNDVFDPGETDRKWLDYVLYSDEHKQPTWATLEPVRPRSDPAMELCMTAADVRPVYPDSRTCVSSRSVTDLSDHYAVLGVLSYGEEQQTSTTSSTTRERVSTTREHVHTTDTGSSLLPSLCLLVLCLLYELVSKA